jgi:hypothetical protein
MSAAWVCWSVPLLSVPASQDPSHEPGSYATPARCGDRYEITVDWQHNDDGEIGFTAGPARRLRASPRHPRPTGAHSAGAPTGYSMTQPGQHSDGLTTACVMTHAVTRWSAADRSLRRVAGGSSVPASGGADKRMSPLRLVNDRATIEPCRAIP